jgi:arylsulfatase A-like enzyme
VKPTRVALIGAGLGALWLVAYFIIVPDVVADAYAGRSFLPFLNRAISGQSLHPVEHYASIAQRALLVASVAGIVAVGAGVATWHWRTSIKALTERLLRSGPTIGWLDVILLGAWFGLAGGALEILAEKLSAAGDPREATTVHNLWLGPLSAALMGMLVGMFLVVALRAWKGLSAAVPVVVFAALQAYAIIAVPRIGLQRYAIIMLSLGIAITLVRGLVKVPTPVSRIVRRSMPWMAGAWVATVVAVFAAGWLRSRNEEAVRGTPDSRSPNVLLLILDTVRWQDLSLYGYERQTSPEISRLASTGVTFDRAMSPAPWTLPAHASMLTGLPPDRLSTDFHSPLDDSPTTIAELLRARGYATGGFVANLGYTGRATGLARGFSVYRDYAITPGLFLHSSFWIRESVDEILRRIGSHRIVVRKSADVVNQEFLSWVPSNGTPFFAFLNYFDAHSPYELKPPYDTKFQDSRPRYWVGWNRDHTEAELLEIRASYNSAIAYIDARIGDLLRELERRGVLSNTLVIVSSDHGEHFGEHGGIVLHANSLYLPLLRVPLVMSFPGRLPAGARINEVVSTQQVAATILDVLGIAGDSLPGPSLASHWRRSADRGSPQRGGATVYAELARDNFVNAKDPVAKGFMQSLVVDRLHYVLNGDGVEELYDYVADENELHNLALGPDSAMLLAPFRQLLKQRADSALRRSRVTDASAGRQP